MLTAFGIVPLVAGVVSVIATDVVKRLALRWGLVDHARGSRKIHARAVPRLGGLGILAGIYGALAIGLLHPSLRGVESGDATGLVALGAGGLAIAALGLWDDLRGVGPRTKLVVQLAVALFLYETGFAITRVTNPVGPDLVLGPVSLPVTLLWIAGLSNAINLIDGLDGLAGGVSLAGGIAACCIAVHGGDAAGVLIALALAGGVAGFLVHNAHPASIFMGDTGSLLLGTILAALAVRPGADGGGGVPLIAMIVVLGIPLADTVIAMLRRVASGRPVFSADREHLHHRLVAAGLSQRQAVLVLWGGAALLAGAGVHLAVGSRGRVAVLVAVVGCGAVMVIALGLVSFWREGVSARRQRNRERLRAVRGLAGSLRQAGRLTEVRQAVAAAAAPLRASAVELWLPPDGHGGPATSPPTVPVSWFALDQARPALGAIEVAWPARAGAFDRDAEIAVELLCRHVASAVERLDAPARPRDVRPGLALPVD